MTSFVTTSKPVINFGSIKSVEKLLRESIAAAGDVRANIRPIRTAFGLSRAQLVEPLGLSPNQIAGLESGDRTLSPHEALAVLEWFKTLDGVDGASDEIVLEPATVDPDSDLF